jgi:hypothetical protein
VAWAEDPLRATGLITERFVAARSKVPTLSFAAPRLVGKFLAALLGRVLHLASRIVLRMAESGIRKGDGECA